MKAPKSVRLEVTATIDPDLWDEMQAQGMTYPDLEKAIVKSLTLREPNVSKPVMDIEDVCLLGYNLGRS